MFTKVIEVKWQIKPFNIYIYSIKENIFKKIKCRFKLGQPSSLSLETPTRFLALHECDADHGLNGTKEMEAVTQTPWTFEVMSKVKFAEIRTFELVKAIGYWKSRVICDLVSLSEHYSNEKWNYPSYASIQLWPILATWLILLQKRTQERGVWAKAREIRM